MRVQLEIILVDAAPRLLPSYPEHLSDKAHASLVRLGVTVRCNTMVQEVGPGRVRIATGGGTEELHAATAFWAAGVAASPLAASLAAAAGIETDKSGRVRVNPDCSVGADPDLFAIGDMARFESNGRPLPGVAQVARQQGEFVGKLLCERFAARSNRRHFSYRDYGEMAVIGRVQAVAEVGGRSFTGFFAWLLWLLVHLAYLIGYANRLLVLIQWAWYYVTYGSNVRIITGETAHRALSDPAVERKQARRTR